MSASSPSFSSSSRIAAVSILSANTARDGTGTLPTLATGAVGGSRIERIRAKAGVSTSAGMVRFFLFNDAGVFVHLFAELTVAAISASNTVKTWEGDLFYGSGQLFILPANYTIRCGPSIGEAFTVAAYITE